MSAVVWGSPEGIVLPASLGQVQETLTRLRETPKCPKEVSLRAQQWVRDDRVATAEGASHPHCVRNATTK